MSCPDLFVLNMTIFISGEITEHNQAVQDKPDQINKSPYGDGWLFKVKLADAEVKGLMDEKGYEEFLKQQEE